MTHRVFNWFDDSPYVSGGAAICERCGVAYNKTELRRQAQRTPGAMVKRGALLCRSCLDTPSPGLQSLFMPVDPPAIWNPRPEPYAIDEAGRQMDIYPAVSITGVLVAGLQQGAGFSPMVTLTSGLAAGLGQSATLSPAVALLASVTATPYYVANVTATATLVTALSSAMTMPFGLPATITTATALTASLTQTRAASFLLGGAALGQNALGATNANTV